MHTPSLVKIHWYLLKLSPGNENTDMWKAEFVNNSQNLPISNPRPDLHNIKVQIHWYLLKLLPGKENTDIWRAGNSVKNWQNLPISKPKPDLHNINVLAMFWWKSIGYHTEMKIWTEEHTTDKQMDGETDRLHLIDISFQTKWWNGFCHLQIFLLFFFFFFF